VDPRRRDGLLALATCTLLVAISIRAGHASVLLDPGSALTGIVGSLALELLLSQCPERTRRLWERPTVQAAGVLATLAAGLLAWQLAPWLLAVLVWGLVAYLALLVVVVVGENPLSRSGQS
jgi:MFS superfamily sulfate permease-like transporter